MSGGMESLTQNETYQGSENEIQMKVKNRGEFICIFSNIDLFPFGEQNCSIELFVSGSDNSLTNLKPSVLKYNGPSSVGQYVIEKWSMQKQIIEDREQLTITVKLGRDKFSILLVTYIPTLLMNIINQATNYINTKENYVLIITVNITCMMVLASVYLSVCNSLPSTASIKPVEIWLLFNLAYPFLVIIVNILLQVLN